MITEIKSAFGRSFFCLWSGATGEAEVTEEDKEFKEIKEIKDNSTNP